MRGAAGAGARWAGSDISISAVEGGRTISAVADLKPVEVLSDRASVRHSASAAASASSAVSGFGGSGPRPSASRTEISAPKGGSGIIMGTGEIATRGLRFLFWTAGFWGAVYP